MKIIESERRDVKEKMKNRQKREKREREEKVNKKMNIIKGGVVLLPIDPNGYQERKRRGREKGKEEKNAVKK